MTTVSTKPFSFAVVGAGIAGLSCATLLQQAGHKVSVFDKSRGSGGRMSTRRGEGWECDHGAQYFTARDPDFRAEVARWQQAGVAGLWSPRLQVFNPASLQEAQPREATLERFVGTPTMTAPAHFVDQTLALTHTSTILQLQHQPDGWQLLSDTYGWSDQRFDAVLLALPAPQVVPLLSTTVPVLSALAENVTMQGCWTLMLRFATPLALTFDAAFVNVGPLRWIARNNSKPGRTGEETWLLHASAEWSEDHLELDPDVVAPLLLQAFRELVDVVPEAWSAHRWRYATTDAPALANGCAWDAENRLGLCGDWLNGGKVEGAWLSGRALAQHVLTSFGASDTER
ncbi:NAD(P)/FAD-dependent oxidoreductase [Glaciimonas sp. GG7]